ncbi:MAG: chromate transporter [Kiritimatiellales bacterium]
MKELFRELAVLYGLFCRIGLFSIGGGYVMLPMLRSELLDKRGWVDDQELLDYYAIGQATPGIIAINTATFVGFKRRGIAGAVASTAGMVTPSLIIILLIAALIPAMQTNPLVQKAFKGIRVAVAVLLCATLISLARKGWTGLRDVLLSVAAFTAVILFGTSPIPVIVAAGMVGLIFSKPWKPKS